MLDFIKNAVNTLAGPMASVVDLAGDALGLPPLLTNSIKVAAGVMTGNMMMAASGAMGVVSELQKNPPAQTEFHPSREPAQAQEGYAPAAPATCSPQTGSAATPAPSTGYLEPSVLEYRESLRTITANFGLLDTLCGGRNGRIDQLTLQVAALDPHLSVELRSAARFLLEHPEYRNMVDTGGKGGMASMAGGTLSQLDVQRALKNVDDDIARYGVRQPGTPAPSMPPAPGTPPPAGHPGSPVEPRPPSTGQPGCPVQTQPPWSDQPGTSWEGSPPIVPAPRPGAGREPSGSVSDIINNPNMSMEEKLQAILTLTTRDTDDEILDVMHEMSSARDERAKLGTDEKSRAREAKLETTMEQLNLRLQKLMEKRKQMFDLMSNVSSKFNEMAKQAIQNLGRA